MKYLFALILFYAVSASAADVEVTVTNLRNQKGQINVAVFDEAGYPKVAYRNAAGKEVKLVLTPQESSRFIIELPPGEYSIGAVHDENQNGKLDGVPPTEGGSFTGGVGFFGPKKWKKSKFTVPAQGTSVTIKMRYWL